MKKEKDDIRTNTIGQSFNLTKFEKQVDAYNHWLLGHHLVMHKFVNIKMDYVRNIKETINEKCPYNYIDGCHWLEDNDSSSNMCQKELDHAVYLAESVLHWFDSIKHDYGYNVIKMARKKMKSR